MDGILSSISEISSCQALIIINDSEIDSGLSVYTSSSSFTESVDKLYEAVE